MEVMCDTEGESVKYKPGGRLDMSHGFLKHIRRNQIARSLSLSHTTVSCVSELLSFLSSPTYLKTTNM